VLLVLGANTGACGDAQKIAAIAQCMNSWLITPGNRANDNKYGLSARQRKSQRQPSSGTKEANHWQTEMVCSAVIIWGIAIYMPILNMGSIFSRTWFLIQNLTY
jgi:hypothetical protein